MADIAEGRVRMRRWIIARRARRSRRARMTSTVASAATLLLVLLLAFLLPLPHNPLTPDQNAVLQPPSAAHWFGTDTLGRDVFGRTIRAARIDLPVALIGALCSTVVGVPIGLVVGMSRRRWARRFMRVLDILQAFPFLVLAIVLVAVFRGGSLNLVIAIGIIYIPQFIRLVRSEVLTLREMRFIEAASALGASHPRVLFRHMLPNVAPTVLVQTSLTAAQSILVVASLSYIGLGVPPPSPSWGQMINDGTTALTTGSWWPVAFPGLMVFVCILSLNLLSDGLDSYLIGTGRD